MILKRKLIYCGLIFLCTLMYTSCDSSAIVIKEQARFFDLKKFFAAEAKRLSSPVKVKKTTSINAIEEIKEVEIENIGKELDVFAASDINRIAWIDSYKVDSILGKKEELLQLNYTALEDKLRTRSLRIYFTNQEVDSLVILNERVTAIANSSQHIIYKPQTGYQIKSMQDISFASMHELEVQVEFLD